MALGVPWKTVQHGCQVARIIYSFLALFFCNSGTRSLGIEYQIYPDRIFEHTHLDVLSVMNLLLLLNSIHHPSNFTDFDTFNRATQDWANDPSTNFSTE